jgi:peroxiredoxin
VRDDPDEDRLSRLDPDVAAAAASAPPLAAPGAPVRRWPSRRNQLLAGLITFGVLLGLALLTLGGRPTGTIGVPAGSRLPLFAAPLAGTTLVGDGNLHPPCTSARHDPRALNVCLLAVRGPLALVFFTPGKSQCIREVDTLQALAERSGVHGVQVAAVAVATGPKAAAAMARAHHWTIPVAYDRDGAIGAAYGVVVCPLIELARRGGLVFERLIGNRWVNPPALSAQLQRLARG